MRKKKKRRHIGFPIFLLLVVLILFLLYDSNTRITVDEYPLPYGNLPAAFDGYRIAQLSDIHAAVFGGGNSRLVDAVKKSRPDIIVITGDLIDANNELGIVDPLMLKLTAIAPVYYITGNHEWDSGANGLKDLLKALGKDGVTVLRNASVKLKVNGAAIVLAGIDDPNGPKDMKSPETLISEIRINEGDPFIILLAHRNNSLDRFSRLGIDLVLCGHVHGGLIRLPFVGGLIGPRGWLPKFSSGVYTEGGTKMLVSRGIGNHTGIPRFLNNPEIPLVILKKS